MKSPKAELLILRERARQLNLYLAFYFSPQYKSDGTPEWPERYLLAARNLRIALLTGTNLLLNYANQASAE